ncbi:hypothetical protein BKA93DRAFT_742093, partial [Sparassis latifolia]
SEVPLGQCPTFHGKVNVYYSAAATYFAPSDPSGTGGMRREHIRATPQWRKRCPRFDCVLVNSQFQSLDGLWPNQDMPDVARVQLFFGFVFNGVQYRCALVHWFDRVGDAVDDETGMWIVKPRSDGDVSAYPMSVIPLDSILRAAHLIPVFGNEHVPARLEDHHSLDVFRAFYLNKYADHHAFELLS